MKRCSYHWKGCQINVAGGGSGLMWTYAGRDSAGAIIPTVEAAFMIHVEDHEHSHNQRNNAQTHTVPVPYLLDGVWLHDALESISVSEPFHQHRIPHHHQEVIHNALDSAQVIIPTVILEQPSNIVRPPTQMPWRRCLHCHLLSDELARPYNLSSSTEQFVD